MSKNSSGNRQGNKHVIKTPFSDIECDVVYPEENPEFALHDVTKVLGVVGIFDGIQS